MAGCEFRRSVLSELADGKISVDEAWGKLFAAVPEDGWPEEFYEAPELASGNLGIGSARPDVANQLGDVASQLGSFVTGAAKAIFGGRLPGQSAPTTVEDTSKVEAAFSTDDRAFTKRVRIRAISRRVRVVADPKVATVSVDGPHKLRSNGNVLEVVSEGELTGNLKINVLRGLDGIRLVELVVRVNPRIVVDAGVMSGRLVTQGVEKLGSIRVTGGSSRLVGVHHLDDALMQASTSHISGSFDTSNSVLRVESGLATVELVNADVTVTASAHLGRVSWPDGQNGVDEYVAGVGTGRLKITVVMGKVNVAKA